MRPLLSAVMLLAAAAAPAADYTFTGYARDLDTGIPLYIETHFVRDAGTPAEQRIVLYRRTENAAPFARKHLRYAADRARPDFEFVCARSRFTEGSVREGAAIRVTAMAPDEAPRSKLLPLADVGVVDAGFDEFVRANWRELERGAAVTAPFLVPSRLDTFTFKVRKVEDTVIDGAAASVIRLSLSGALGWFLPDLHVTYRKQDQRLLRYRGLTNVRDADGELIEAQIDFPDAGRSEGAVDLAKLQELPLTGI